MKTNIYGDIAIDLLRLEKHNLIGRGDLGILHDVYDSAIDKGMKPLKNNHPINVHMRVLNAIDRDDRFEKGYIKYTGVINRPCRCFKLKEEFVDWD